MKQATLGEVERGIIIGQIRLICTNKQHTHVALPYCVLLQCFSLCLYWALNVLLQVSSSLQLLPGQPLELPSQATGTLYLRSSHTICYSLFRTGCNEVVRGRKEGGKETRDAHVVKADEEEAVNREFAFYGSSSSCSAL